jgi:hypothetical protein
VADRGLGGRRGSWRLAAAAALALAACGGGAGGETGTGPTSDEPAPDTAATAETTGSTTPPEPAAPATPTTSIPSATTPSTTAPPVDPGRAATGGVAVDGEAAEPTRVQIRAIGVEAPVIALGIEPSGALAAPDDAADAGWWADGPEPGERGPAVIAGHVDSRHGPAVFYRLRELRSGDTVEVARADGSRVAFVVTRVERHPKAAFPTEAVYGDTPGSELRLVTCGGAFDRSTGHYLDNVIAYATRR